MVAAYHSGYFCAATFFLLLIGQDILPRRFHTAFAYVLILIFCRSLSRLTIAVALNQSLLPACPDNGAANIRRLLDVGSLKENNNLEQNHVK
ncbi:hypothetical protein D0911_02325 [Zhongshania marina]|uniref:Uncharacterized protein n=1 Tax=Zhongshania marina TaxID=2304603 RepID=A0ABX9W6R7_9GAMM|nr:hypothetical protein D0911_02325 [Zhongshania marina]